MKKQLIALSLAAACLVAASTPATAAPRPKPPTTSTATVLEPLICGPDQLFIRWTGTDPTSIALKYQGATVFNFAPSSDQARSNSLIANLFNAERAVMRSVSGVNGKSTGWTWVASTSSVSVTSAIITCDAKDPLVSVH